MKVKWKIIIALAVVIVAGIGLYASTVYSHKGQVTVQTGQVVRQDLTSFVTASGEIKPKNYIDIGANAQQEKSRNWLVKEGAHVRKGQLLARIEACRPQADVDAQKATVTSAESDSAAAEAGLKSADENIKTMQAGVDHDRADLDRMQADYKRAEALYNEKLGAKQDFEMKKYTYDAQVAAIKESEARVQQARVQRDQQAAQLASAQRHILQAKAGLVRTEDVLKNTTAHAPLDGVVTNLPVRVGESVVTGIQNSEGSTIMTIADMSVITAEVKVDETDIVNIKLGQTADITIDAIPNKIFKGHVTEIGDTAIVRSTGVAASQSTTSSQEAKDFKVVIAMDDPPGEVRPGLSCTAKIITTATKPNVLTIPIQAMTVRQPRDLEPHPAPGSVAAATQPKLTPAEEKAKKEEIQGVFVVENGKAVFHKVETGITGATDIEVLSGLNENDQIVTGTYQVIRTIKNEALVKIDNKPLAVVTKS